MYVQFSLPISVIERLMDLLYQRTEKADIKLAKTVPRKRYTFLEDAKYLREDMFESREETLRMLHNWIPLSSGSFMYLPTFIIF